MSEFEEEKTQKKALSFASVWDSPHWQAGWGNGVIAAMGLLNLLILSSTLSASSFGQWGVFITGSSFLELLRTGMVQSSLIKYTSGLTEEEERPFLSASIWLGIGLTFLLLLFLFILSQTVEFNANDSFYLFFSFVPIQLVSAFPLMFGLWRLQAKRRFIFMFRLRLVVFGVFTFFILLHSLYPFDVIQIVLFFILGHIIGSIICLYNGLADLSFLGKFPKKAFKQMLQFGRYSMGSMTSIHLIKSADTLILGAMLKPEIVAIYHLPIRLTEWSDLLIRSMAANAYPRLSEITNTLSTQKMKLRFRRVMGMYTFSTFLFSIVPALLMALISIWFAQQSDWLLWYILAFTTLLAPFYRFLGIGIEVLHKPHLNFLKLSIMLVFTVIGDLYAIYVWNSLEAVALVTLLAYIFGIAFGSFMLSREIELNVLSLWKQTLRWLRWKKNRWQGK